MGTAPIAPARMQHMHQVQRRRAPAVGVQGGVRLMHCVRRTDDGPDNPDPDGVALASNSRGAEGSGGVERGGRERPRSRQQRSIRQAHGQRRNDLVLTAGVVEHLEVDVHEHKRPDDLRCMHAPLRPAAMCACTACIDECGSGARACAPPKARDLVRPGIGFRKTLPPNIASSLRSSRVRPRTMAEATMAPMICKHRLGLQTW
jgi:hypothetical protein